MLGRDEVTTGLLLKPWPLATMVMAPIAGRLIERFHAGLLGVLGLPLLPAQPPDADIIWRMMLCGAGFGLFQSPNNHTIISSAPRQCSSSGAALVALMSNLFNDSGTHASLLLAGTFASVAAIVSMLRMTQTRQPEES